MPVRFLTVLFVTLLPCTTAMAGWGDLLKKIEEQAPALMNSEETEPTATTNSGTTSSGISNLSTETLAKGLKEALAVGTERAIAQASQLDGFLGNPAIRIPLPAPLASAETLLRRYGLGDLVDQFATSMNRAAETAAPQASRYFGEALQSMTIDEARTIYQGGDDSATRYFQNKTSAQLTGALGPSIDQAIEEAGVTRYYQQLMGAVKKYPVLGNMNADLSQHVTQGAVDGLFVMLAEEEKKIRAEPLARTTDLLKSVFGGSQ